MRGRRIRVSGQVQGVGFRPHVWRLAQRSGIIGSVRNDATGVTILAAGEGLERFEKALRDAPPLARIDRIDSAPHVFDRVPAGFEIVGSQGGASDTGVTPDAATCPDCRAEILDPTQRRYRYGFANCTNCGPRFTILTRVPYDRAQTSMATFKMCAACRAEYDDPADRRFHAQPVACPDCGPRLWVEKGGLHQPGDAIGLAANLLRDGAVLAVKGLGGFQLACDANNNDAVESLRRRKHRPAKPFALMGRLPDICAHSRVSPAETALLTDPAAPIVLLERAGPGLPDAIAPGLAALGWMLPNTPLHHLLLEAFGGPLVMSSGNISGEPQVIGNGEARDKLGAIADAFVLHDREIVRRLDDGVERITPQGRMVLRRGRGRVPGTLALPDGFADAPPVTAYGGQLKSSICLLKAGRALLSHHLGDLDEPLTWAEYQKADHDYGEMFDHDPQVIACDLHPEMRASGHARQRAVGRALVEVQHHHAHMAACMADNLWPLEGGAMVGIVLDGLGLGADGTIWGGEVLVGDYRRHKRVAHLAPAPLVGGDAAQREPWRNAVMRLDQAGLGVLADQLFSDQPRDLIRRAAAAGINAPLSSSAGRLFDAVAACLGLAAKVQSYEGEAAVRLEALAGQAGGIAAPYPFEIAKQIIDPSPMFRALADDLWSGVAPATIAARFHSGLARVFADTARAQVEAGRAKAVALSGGCFQNPLLQAQVVARLDGIPVLCHRDVPSNDGGLALGQAVVAAARALAWPNANPPG